MKNSGTMEITTVIGCKVQCRYCPQTKLVQSYVNKSKSTRMSWGTFKTCIDKIPTDVAIHFSGMAEPWLNPACTDMLLYAAEREHPIAVFTTLVGMKRKDFDQIKHIPFTSFILHLPDANGYAKINITPEFLSLLRYVVNFFNHSPLQKSFGASCHGLVDPIVLEEIGDKAFDVNNNIGVSSTMIDRAGNVDLPELKHFYHDGAIICQLCSRLMNQNVLLPNGDVILCCMDYGMEYSLGNLLTEDYPSLFKSDTIRDLRKAMKDDTKDIICRHCSNAIQPPRPQFQILGPDIISQAEDDKVKIFAGFLTKNSKSKVVVIDDIATVDLEFDIPHNSVVIIPNAIESILRFPYLKDSINRILINSNYILLTEKISKGFDVKSVESRLNDQEFPVEFFGLVQKPGNGLECLAILSKQHAIDTIKTPQSFKVIAIITTYNEEDVIIPVIKQMNTEGVYVYVIDNWSTDNTYDLVSQLVGKGVIGLEHFPKKGLLSTSSWEQLLKRKEQLALELRANWFIHSDADEIRESPWSGINLRDAFYLVDQQGYNAVNFTALNFVPVNNDFVPGSLLTKVFKYFEFGARPGHFLQTKAWKNTGIPVNLISSGGHDVLFENKRVYPLKFLLRHYPIRSQSHGQKKVALERKLRFDKGEMEGGVASSI